MSMAEENIDGEELEGATVELEEKFVKSQTAMMSLRITAKACRSALTS